jgi:PAS domain S-box-containing protein
MYILIVEDEPAHAERMERSLSEQRDPPAIRVVRTLAEAREALDAAPPDLVLADLVLPDGPGTALLPANGDDPPYPLIVFTSHGDEGAAVHAIKAGALDYVVKSDRVFRDMPRIVERASREWSQHVRRKQAEAALRAERERLYALLDGLPAVVFLRTPDYRIPFANAVFRSHFGDPQDRACFEITRQLSEPCRTCPTDSVLKDQKRVDRECTSPSGRRFVVHAFPFTDIDGSPLVLEVGFDVTERHHAEQARAATERREREFRERLENLSGVTSELSTAATFDELCRRAVDLGHRRLGFDRLGLHFIREDRAHVVGSFGIDENGNVRDERGILTRIDDRARRIIAPNDPSRVYRAENVPLHNDRHVCVGHGATAWAPVWDGKRIIGFLTTDDLLDKRGINDHDAELLRFYATSIGHLCSRQRAEEARQQSAERFREVFENMSSGVAIYEAVNDGEDFVFKDINPSGARIGRLKREDHLGKSVLEVYPGVKALGLFAALQQVWRTGVPQRYPMSAYEDERISLWVENYVCKLPTGEVVTVYDDITERKRVDAERERLRSAIEQAAEVIVITDVEGTIQYVNPAFERVTGYSRDQAVGQNPRILKSGEHDEAFYRTLWETISGGGTWKGRMVNRRKDGTLYTEEAAISPVRDAAGTIVNYVAVKRDITRVLELEAQYRHAHKMEAVGTLASGIAHDFNNLLTAILGYTALAARTLRRDHPAIASLEMVEEAARQATGVTRSLLTFSRRAVTERKPTLLNDTIADSLRLLRRVLPATVEVVDEIPAHTDIWANADATQIQQVLLNLVVNARDAMQTRGTLRIALSTRPSTNDAPEWAVITVADTGVGMSEDVRTRVFEPFFTTKPREKGTGLGMSVIHGIVTDHDGSIEIESREGTGTTVHVLLPRCAAPGAPPREKPSRARRGRGEVIIVIEDDDQIRSIVASTLRIHGYEVVQAPDGTAALAAFDRHARKTRLVILDMDIPKISGLECLAEIRRRSAGVPVLVITGNVEFDADACLHEGEDLLRKPFRMTELTALVGRRLAPQRPETTTHE